MAGVILLEHVICFPCLSEYRHQPIPALHIPCTAWNITFISMICHFHCCLRLFLHNTCRTSDGSAGGWHRTWAGICKCWGLTISDPDCSVTVSVMSRFAYFSVVFFYSRDLHKYRTLIIQLCQGKHSFPFYGTFTFSLKNILKYFIKGINLRLFIFNLIIYTFTIVFMIFF